MLGTCFYVRLTIHHNNHLHHVAVGDDVVVDADNSVGRHNTPDSDRPDNKNRWAEDVGRTRRRNDLLAVEPT